MWAVLVALMACNNANRRDSSTFVECAQDVDEDGVIDVACGGSDCDDLDPSVNPGQAETCDEVDQDCDVLVDEHPVDGVLVWPDLDGDGHGNGAAQPQVGCATDPSFSELPDDCADQDGLVFPRHVRVGTVGCEGFGAAQVWTGEADRDGAGDQVFGIGDLNGDGAREVAASAPRALKDAGVLYLLDLGTIGRTSLVDAPRRIVGDQAGDQLGYDVADIGDWDGDGSADLAVGAPGGDGSLQNQGWVSLLAGPITGSVTAAEVTMLRIFGIWEADALGAVASAADTDGDGLAELVVGSQASALYSGYVALVERTEGLPATGDVALSEVASSLLLGELGVGAGNPAPGGDLDGDGLADLLVGAQLEPTNGLDSGAVYVLYGPIASGSWSLELADAKLLGAAESLAGHAIDLVGDLDGDGLVEYLIGAPYANTKAGEAYVLRGGAYVGIQELPAVAHAVIGGEGVGDRAGFSVAGVGDVNGDGTLEIAVGAKFEDSAGFDAGSIYLLDGTVAGEVLLADAPMQVFGESGSDLFGDLAGAGDLDGDGLSEIIVGAREYEEPKGVHVGAAYLVFGAPF
jgi:Putative metal-binding motif/FG-GAP repeat